MYFIFHVLMSSQHVRMIQPEGSLFLIYILHSKRVNTFQSGQYKFYSIQFLNKNSVTEREEISRKSISQKKRSKFFEIGEVI